MTCCAFIMAQDVSSHGVATKTVTEGCLTNFPSVIELEECLSRMVAEELGGLYNRLQRDGRQIKIEYLELCMIYRFFLRLANRLMVAVAIGVRSLSKQQPILWKYTGYLVEKSFL